MGGAPPMGATALGGNLLCETTTERLVKCSVSLATLETISCVVGNQPPA